MDTDDEGVFEAARAIRPYLEGLLASADTAEGLDRQLAELLTSSAAGRSNRGRQLLNLLDQHEDTAWFLAEVLADAPYYRPPYHQPGYLRDATSAGPLGDPDPPAADSYICTHGDYVWYRPDLGTPIPSCPTHQTRLERS